MKKEDALLFGTDFAARFFHRRLLLLLSFLLFCGVVSGGVLAVDRSLFRNQTILPLLFSGIPTPQSGFLTCFSAVLLNILMGQIVLFLLGVTAFGALGVPVFLFCKGVSLGIGVISFLWGRGLVGLRVCAVSYTPAAAASSLLLLLFAVRALRFSNGLAKAGFSARQESLDFQCYFKDFLTFLCFAVMISLAGALLAVLSGVML